MGLHPGLGDELLRIRVTNYIDNGIYMYSTVVPYCSKRVTRLRQQ